MDISLATRVRFGAFELDLKAGELRKGTRRVLLQEQPFQILRMLLECSGHLVTREEIRKKLWPNDTVVEFDHSIHTAIGKLRQALGDSAESPKYVETVARRGYRLLMPVECVGIATPTTPDTENEEPVSERRGNLSSVNPPQQPLSGKKVSHYRVLQILGGGGFTFGLSMGTIHSCHGLTSPHLSAPALRPTSSGSAPATAPMRIGKPPTSPSKAWHLWASAIVRTNSATCSGPATFAGGRSATTQTRH